MQSNLDVAISNVLEDLADETREKRANPGSQAILGLDLEREPRWSQEEIDYFRERAPHMSNAEIAAQLGRSDLAVKIKRARFGLSSVTRNELYFTANTAAKALGIDIHSMTRLIELGLVPFEMAPTEKKIYRIRRDKLLAWAVDPMNWPHFLYTLSWRVRKIPDPKIRRMIELRRQRWKDEWLSSGQVARLLGVDSKDVNRVFIKRGQYKGRKGQRANWYFLKSDVLASNVVFVRGKGRGSQSLEWTWEAKHFLVLAIAVGTGNEEIVRMMGNHVNFVISNKLTSLDMFDELAALARGQGIKVRRKRGLAPSVFVDWRCHKHRFPALSRSISRFLAGVRMRRKDILAVNRILAMWSAHHADTAEKKRIAARLLLCGSRFTAKTLRDRYAILKSWGVDPFAILEDERLGIVVQL